MKTRLSGKVNHGKRGSSGNTNDAGVGDPRLHYGSLFRYLLLRDCLPVGLYRTGYMSREGKVLGLEEGEGTPRDSYVITNPRWAQQVGADDRIFVMVHSERVYRRLMMLGPKKRATGDRSGAGGDSPRPTQPADRQPAARRPKDKGGPRASPPTESAAAAPLAEAFPSGGCPQDKPSPPPKRPGPPLLPHSATATAIGSGGGDGGGGASPGLEDRIAGRIEGVEGDVKALGGKMDAMLGAILAQLQALQPATAAQPQPQPQ
jgi:hypothetical protein